MQWCLEYYVRLAQLATFFFLMHHNELCFSQHTRQNTYWLQKYVIHLVSISIRKPRCPKLFATMEIFALAVKIYLLLFSLLDNSSLHLKDFNKILEQDYQTPIRKRAVRRFQMPS